MSTGARDKGHDTVVKRVNRKHEEESHGGAWKVAFADFCLALMCLFLVLWVLAARNTERLEESMRTTRGKLFDEGTGRHIKSLTSATGSLIPREPVPSQGDAPPDARRAYTNGESGRPEKLIGQAYPRTRYDSEAELRKLASTLMNLSQDAGLDSNVQTIVMPYGLRVMLHDTEQQGMFERGSAQPTERAKRLPTTLSSKVGSTRPLSAACSASNWRAADSIWAAPSIGGVAATAARQADAPTPTRARAAHARTEFWVI
ncbi:flagellar motor protein MotB [Curvibacter lanceolatus]|uniref:flagellar motor protein MotB n=1 Tax=Curvibacter lanceolatus TaxID=86182 RepID=UPI00036451BB|nr:flagellar motor protein MotB [Curvibacter lanceolatus]